MILFMIVDYISYSTINCQELILLVYLIQLSRVYTDYIVQCIVYFKKCALHSVKCTMIIIYDLYCTVTFT